MLTFHHLVNKITGQPFYPPAGGYGNFLKACRRAANYVKTNYKKVYCCHVTLTSKLPRMDCFKEEFDRTRNFIKTRLKKNGSDCKYVAVKEIQQKRKEKYGDIVIHYHVLVYYSKAHAMPSPEEVNKSWGIGSVKITAPKVREDANKIAAYLGKYIGKGYEYEEMKERNKYSCSQTPALYSLSWKRLVEALQINIGRPLKVQGRKIFYLDDPFPPFPRTKMYVFEFLSDWRYLGLVGEPF